MGWQGRIQVFINKIVMNLSAWEKVMVKAFHLLRYCLKNSSDVDDRVRNQLLKLAHSLPDSARVTGLRTLHSALDSLINEQYRVFQGAI